MTRIGIKTKISPVVLLVSLIFSSISNAETTLPKGYTYSKPSGGDFCLEYGCVEEDLDYFTREMKGKQIKTLYCSMTSPFQATESNSLNLLVHNNKIFELSVKEYAFYLSPIKSRWNTKSIFISGIIEETDNLLELNRETLTIIEDANPLGRYEYKCELVEFETLARKLEKFIQDSKKANKI